MYEFESWISVFWTQWLDRQRTVTMVTMTDPYNSIVDNS